MGSRAAVTWEDQQDINRFSNLYSRLNELEAQIKGQKKLLDDLDDASAELMLAEDDEPLRVRVGECFWSLDKDAAERKVEQMADEARREHGELEAELAEGAGRLGELRSRLYARLGDSINLDTPYTAAAGGK